MARALIIAYGNPLRSDDGISWRAAEDLSKLPLPPDVEIVTQHQLTPELALVISQSSLVVFVDAAQDGAPGTIIASQLKPQRQSSVFTHEFSPDTILSLAQELYHKAPPAFIVSISGECFDHGEVITPKVLRALPALIARVRELVQQG